MRNKLSISKKQMAEIFGVALAGVFLVAMPILLAGCCDDCQDPVIIDSPPSAPDGFFSVTGDGYVDLYWNPNPEPDLAGYDLFWSDDVDGPLEYIVSLGRHRTDYRDADVENGVTYFYFIRAYDQAGNEGPFSEDIVFDTPRPAGTGLILHDFGQNEAESGYDFSEFSRQHRSLSTTDVYFGSPNSVATLFGKGSSIGAGVDVQDYGFVDLDFVDWAPDIFDGWSPSKQVELIPGHSYVVQIEDGQFYQYAKVFVVSVSNDLVVLDWAYQEAEGNPELAPGVGGAR
ncbi:MAG: fibronectin type III domain-containing protein [Candidatus Latescibacterota bacterium]|nr:MAG: fibronectin type III domain-containing protein [Candidatus Latescibacterota bacterium]